MSSEDIALRVTDLHKSYRLGLADTQLREAVMRRVRHPLQARRVQRFVALDGVSFEVPTGQVLGIIGRNGAGKSTLLKIISRITYPDRGSVDIWGRVGSLIEVGTGFHPELTGRENVFLNGSILGMRRREISRKYDAIVDFSGIESFMDTPVKRYSSGMLVRLAFSVAAHLESEIVILDEVLAVGDVDFQAKCINKIESLTLDEGRTALFVSHNMVPIRRVCQRVILLEHGRMVFDGDTEQAVSLYLDDDTGNRAIDVDAQVVVTDVHGTSVEMLPNGSSAQITVLTVGGDLERGALVITILSKAGEVVAQFASDGRALSENGQLPTPSRTIALSIPALDLPNGPHEIHAATRLPSGRLIELATTHLEVSDGVDSTVDHSAPYFFVPDQQPPIRTDSSAHS